MSQEKVDRRKYEKYHRKEIERKKRIKTVVTCVAAALIVGAIVGVPLGIKIYKEQPKFVGDSTLEAFVSSYIDENYASDVAVLNQTTEDTETTETTENTGAEEAIKDAVEELSGEELEEVDSDNVDEVLGTDSETENSETEE